MVVRHWWCGVAVALACLFGVAHADCGPLQAPPANGEMVCNGCDTNDTCVFSCDYGYLLYGPTNSTCLASGQWSNTDFVTCGPRSCGTFPFTRLTNGVYNCTGIVFQDVCVASCYLGYMLDGASLFECEGDGRWNLTSAPTCEVVTCDTLPAVANSSVTCTQPSPTYADNCTYSCDKGLRINGTATWLCQANGEWSVPSAPICQPMFCDPIVLARHAEASCNGSVVGSSCSVTCHAGFIHSGAKTARCDAQGQWQLAAPGMVNCTPVACGAFNGTAPANGALDCTGSVFPDTCTYSCAAGFDVVGDAVRSCQANGTWSGSGAVSCTPVSCGKLDVKAPDHGSKTCNGTAYGDVCLFDCDDGYQFFGTECMTCQQDGKWSGPYRVACSLITCPELKEPAPLNGTKNCTGCAVGDTCTFQCNAGFALVGDGVRTCQENGTWTGVDSVNCTVVVTSTTSKMTSTTGQRTSTTSSTTSGATTSTTSLPSTTTLSSTTKSTETSTSTTSSHASTSSTSSTSSASTTGTTTTATSTTGQHGSSTSSSTSTTTKAGTTTGASTTTAGASTTAGSSTTKATKTTKTSTDFSTSSTSKASSTTSSPSSSSSTTSGGTTLGHTRSTRSGFTTDKTTTTKPLTSDGGSTKQTSTFSSSSTTSKDSTASSTTTSSTSSTTGGKHHSSTSSTTTTTDDSTTSTGGNATASSTTAAATAAELQSSGGESDGNVPWLSHRYEMYLIIGGCVIAGVVLILCIVSCARRRCCKRDYRLLGRASIDDEQFVDNTQLYRNAPLAGKKNAFFTRELSDPLTRPVTM